MTEEGNENVEDGVVQATESEHTHDDVSKEAQEASHQKRQDEEKNWAEVRRKMQEQQQLIEDSQRKISELTKPHKPSEEENWGINDDDLAEGKHIKELKKELRALKGELKTRDVDSINDRVQMKFPDYNSVVTPENIEKLKSQKPALARALSHMDNQYDMAIDAYDLIKTYVVPEGTHPPVEARRAEENSSKPRSVQAIAKTSALADVNQFSEMDAKGRKAFLRSKYEEMQRAIKAG